MDWYFASGIDDLIVPKGQELSDRLPSPDSWSKWGYGVPGSFKFPNKHFFNDTSLTREEFNFNGKTMSDEVAMGSSTHTKNQGSSACGGLSSESLQQSALSCEQPDYQLNGLAGIEQIDDLFLSSILEDIQESDNIQKSFCFSPESQSGVAASDNLYLTDMISDSQSISSDEDVIGSSKYLKTHSFSPSLDWGKNDFPASQFIPSEQKDCALVKAPPGKVMVPLEDTSTNGYVDKETSLEESVLQELEVVMTQLSNKTRICFRDALYRLAENSRQPMTTQNRNGDLAMETSPLTAQDERMRSGGRKLMESETNTIDRAIANLMFNKMDLNVHDFPVSSSVSSNQEVSTTGPQNYNSNRQHIQDLPSCTIFPDDG